MDTTRDIIYRLFVLNDEDIDASIVGGGASGSGIEGCTLDTFDYSDVDVIQWSEKRAQGDGSDAGDVFLGVRRIRYSGTLYAKTRAVLFDNLWTLRAALNPVLAQREEPLDKGYRPLYFSVPTNREADYPAGAIELKVLALPRGIQHLSRRQDIGGDDNDALAITFTGSFICKDPGIYGASPVSVDLDTYPSPVTTGVTSVAATDLFTKTAHGLVAGDRVTFFALTGGTGLALGTAYYVIAAGLTANDFAISATSGGASFNHTTNVTAASYVKSVTIASTWNNRGTYLGAFNGLFVVGAGAGTISVTVGDSVFTVTVPVSTVNRTIRVKADKVLTFEENSVESLQMSRIAFTGDTTWPLIDPGSTPYSLTFHGMAGLQAGGRFWFDEQYA